MVQGLRPSVSGLLSDPLCVFPDCFSSCVLLFPCLLLSAMCSVVFPLPLIAAEDQADRQWPTHPIVISSHLLALYKPCSCRPLLSVCKVELVVLHEFWNWLGSYLSLIPPSVSLPAVHQSVHGDHAVWGLAVKIPCCLVVGPWKQHHWPAGPFIY